MKTTKRIFAVFMAVMMLICAVPFTDAGLSSIFPKASAESTQPDIIYYGDIDENGKLTASDAREILRCGARLIQFTERQRLIADINGDGNVTIADARLALRMSVSLEAKIIFKQKENVTNGEWLKMLMGNLGYSGYDNGEPYFASVGKDSEYFDIVQSAVEWKILTPEGFDPSEEATYGFIAETAVKAAKIPYEDDHFSAAISNKIIPDNTLPESSCTVNDAYKVVENAKKISVENYVKEPSGDIILNDDVIDYTESEEFKAVDGDTYIYNPLTADVPDINTVFIAPPSEEYPDGAARKVSEITKNPNGTYTVETVTPALDEVFEQFDIVDTVTAEDADVKIIPVNGVEPVGGSAYSSYALGGNAKGKKLFEANVHINSSDNKDLGPEIVLKTTSDYTDKLNSEWVANNDDIKEVLENYNTLVTGVDDNGEAEIENVEKYSSGWTLDGSFSIDNLQFNCDFGKFWDDGSFTFGVSADFDSKLEYKGYFNGEIKIASFELTKWYQKLFMKYGIDIFVTFDINGNATFKAVGKLDKGFTATLGERAHTLNNDTIDYSLEANIHAEADFHIYPAVEVLGIELAYMDLSIGAEFDGHTVVKPAVIYKGEKYFYKGDPLTNSDLKTVFNICVDAELSCPIITLTISAGDKVKEAKEKLRKKYGITSDISLTKHINICTKDDNSMLDPYKFSLHYDGDTTGKLVKVKKCTIPDLDTLAHTYSGYVVDKETGERLDGAKVELINKDNKTVATAYTDTKGEFILYYMIYDDNYTLKITKDKIENTFEKIKINTLESDGGKFEFEKKITPEMAVKLYMDNKNMWLSYESYAIAIDYTFFDIDLDGCLELMTTVSYGGTASSMTNYFFRIDQKTMTVKSISTKNEPEFYGIMDIEKLLYNKATGEIKYIVNDPSRVGPYVYQDRMFIKPNGTAISYEEFYGTELDWSAGTSTPKTTYYVGNKTLTASQFNNFYANALKNYTVIDLTFKTVDYKTFKSASTAKQTQLLLEAYKSFNYYPNK